MNTDTANTEKTCCFGSVCWDCRMRAEAAEARIRSRMDRAKDARHARQVLDAAERGGHVY